MEGFIDVVNDRRLSSTILRYYTKSVISYDDPSPHELHEENHESRLEAQVTLSARKMALTVDRLDGHGSWKLELSTRFLDNLRVSRKRPRLFAKIKDTLW